MLITLLSDTDIYIIRQLENTLLLIATSFLGIWILISEIAEIFKINQFQFLNDSFTDSIFFNIFGIIAIIPISIVLNAIQKRSKILYGLFYFASLLEVGIIITRLYFYSSDHDHESVLGNDFVVYVTGNGN